MCGIAGLISLDKSVTPRKIKTLTDAIAHRGPDGEGQWVNEQRLVGLGHRRLSILDLSTAGAQPMKFGDGRYTITFNGEIYNYIELKKGLQQKGYQFHTNTDTEVLLALYQEEQENCLTQLDGMFAFAIWDEIKKELFCARDRFGEKPFFYFKNKGSFIFASELKALWAHGIPKEINQEQLYYYLKYNLVNNPHKPSTTFYQNIFQLKPSHYLKFTQKGNLTIKKYWDIDLNNRATYSFEEAINQFNELFTESINRRLRSDVPVGSSLSGGLDSSAIVTMIDKLKGANQTQKTFSARFKNFEKDEGLYMNEVIQHTNVEPHFTWPNATTFIDEFERLCFHQDEPFGSGSIFAQWKVMEAAKKNKVTVLLDGQGADEIAAGYFHYFRKYYGELYRTNKKIFHAELKAYQALYGKKFNNSLLFKFQSTFPKLFGQLKNFGGKYTSSDNLNLSSNFTSSFKNSPNPFSIHFDLNKDLKVNTMSYGLNNLLRYCDRNSMAHSREVRLPFLSHKLVEFLFSLPPAYKIQTGWTKFIIRKSMEGTVPEKILWRKDKVGYEPPQNKWVQEKRIKDIYMDCKEKLVKEKILPETNNSGPNIFNWKVMMAGYYLQ